MFKPRISKEVKKQIKKLKKEYQSEVLEALDVIKEDPLSGKSLGRKLTRRFSYRFGVFRIVYMVNIKDNVVNIFSADHRGKVYN